MTWSKARADAWLSLYTKLRQAGWKRHNDGTWSHFARGTMHFTTPEAQRIQELEEERNARIREQQ